MPETTVFARPKELAARYLWLGENWDGGEHMAYTGLRSVVHEMVAMDSGGCMGNRTLADGPEVLDLTSSPPSA